MKKIKSSLSKKQMTLLETILENSKAWRQAIASINEGLAELGYSEYEAQYLTSFYTQIKNLDLFKSKLFDSQIAKYDVDLPLPDVSFFAKRPAIFRQMVLYLLHSPDLLNNYDIIVDETGTVTKLNKKSLEQKDSTGYSDAFASAKFDKYRVAQDANYITYYVPTPALARAHRTWYNEVHAETLNKHNIRSDELTSLYPSWCVYSSSNEGYFYSYKGKNQGDSNSKHLPEDKVDHWYVTWPKRSILEILDMKENPHKYGLSGNTSDLKDILCETFLKQNGPNRTSGGAGLHAGSNPGTPTSEANSRLVPKKTYSYANLSIKSRPAVGISGDTLEYLDVDTRVVQVPAGVKVLKMNSIKGNNIETVILPPSVVKIESGAIQSEVLRQVLVTHNLEIVEKGAIVSNYQVILGVLQHTETGVLLVKPASLKYCDRAITNYMRELQSRSADDEAVAALVPLKSASRTQTNNTFGEARKTDFKFDLYLQDEYVDVERGQIISVSQLADGQALIMPEGASSISAIAMEEAMNLGVKKLVVSSTAVLGENLFHKFSGEVDLSRCNPVIPSRAFSHTLFETLVIPAHVSTIEHSAFSYAQQLEEVTIMNKDVLLSEQAFKKTPFLDVVYIKDYNQLSDERKADLASAIDVDIVSI